ncbi:sister chromatid cohesion protein Mis4 [Paecilomyces variotii No. 5]|uniref:Sister chromatid cohesion protein n=1 Tax=Byssochlamys spectabilis (strain No. 5 / NBRC 109023) TaxID=1356009 RepID=V5FPI2_BYSSN|nr:sister chromatid cohesion protein Mis4 [Paecilomyces variotii No. 5]
MDQIRQPAVQVVINGHPQTAAHGHGTVNGMGQHFVRPLSVDEALRYSPMSSAPIFGLDCILHPDIGRSATTATVGHDRAAHSILHDLDSEIRSGSGESTRLETTREYLQQLLDGDQLTEFKFKLPGGTATPSTLSPASHTQSIGPVGLGPFARMMLETTDIAYRYPTPATPSSKSKDGAHSQKSLPTPVSTSRGSSSFNEQAFIQNKTLHAKEESPVKPTVIIPPLPPSSQHAEYEPLPEQSFKKRKLDNDVTDNLRAIRLRDQKEEADAALLKLQDVLHEIFEAEDRLEPDTSSLAAAPGPTAIFKTTNSLEVNGFILTSEIHSRLQKAIQKVVNFGRLQDIPSEYLTRVQKLCEGPIISAQAPDLKLDDPSNDSESQEWLKKVEDMHNALLAINTLLQTMSGSGSERDLCPEELVQAIPGVLNQIFDNCIIPAVEARLGGKDSQYFEFFSAHRQIIGSLTHQTKKVLALLAKFLSRVDVSEGTITATEFLAAKLIFVENAHNDKESAVGHQRYESVRRGAMDVLAKIFSRYPLQRPYILDEILVSLEKLPSTRQNARQFKLIDGKNIQFLTALVLQLVQTTALEVHSNRRSKNKRRPPMKSERADDDDELLGDGDDQEESESDEDLPASRATFHRLASRVDRLHDNAVRSAQYIVKFIVQRAMTSTKTGDQPYRNILDLFTEDLISVLGSTDWPAAELLLRVMASHMVGLADHDKSPATVKNMALEILGWMGSAISDLTAAAQHSISSMEDSGSDLTEYLRQSFDEHSRHALHPEDLISPEGPYRIALEYLQERDLGDWQLTSARGYYLTQWAKTACLTYYDSNNKDLVSRNNDSEELLMILSKMLEDPLWLETHSHFNNVSSAHGKFAYIITVLNMGFCKAFDMILKVLLNSITSDQAKVRSRSLKSVIAMLEKDPNLLDRDASVMRVILRCATDASPMVRDSALSLIAKCITLKPALEEEGCRTILACAADPTPGVRKRCIGLLKDIYLKTTRNELKLAMLDSLLQRTGDLEEGVALQARQTFEDIWLTPFHNSIDSIQDAPKLKVALAEQVSLIINLIRRSEAAVDSLGLFLRKILSDGSKTAPANFKVCKAMVSNMFDRLVDDAELSDKEHQQALLQTITVFAKANAKLFSPDQLKTLHPYIGNLVTADDLYIFKSVVVIYRCVLPYVSTAHNTLLKEVQNDLFKSVAKLARAELNEVMACLWTINGVLQNTERLVKLTISVLKGIEQARKVNLAESGKADVLARARSYVRIAGCVGRYCDLEKYGPHFKNSFPGWKGGSVAGLMVDSIIPFTSPNQPLELRVMALESLGSICQSWPAQFGREESRRVFSQVFKEDNANLQNIVLKAFSEFFAIHEGKTEKLVQPSAGDTENTTRLGGSLRASDNDGAAALIAQHFLRDMLRVAQSRQDAYSLTAIELIASINRQGLVHPKECAGVLVSLETSTIPAIAKVAFDTHKMLHLQYESMFDREYMRAVQDAFYYQRDVVGEPMGATARPYVAKLAPLFEIIKTSNSKYQKKFLANLCSKVNFELKDLDLSGNPPEHLLLSRFLCQNLAFFEYGQLAELLPTIACMERIVAATGTIVGHSIETDIFPPTAEPPPVSQEGFPQPVDTVTMPPSHSINPQTLRQLATAATALSMLWEARTHLRRFYGINSHVRQKEGKNTAKELNKPPTKVHGVTGDRLWEAIAKNMTSLESEENMLAKCREFATLLSIDDELKVSADDDADRDSADEGMDVDDTGTAFVTNGMKPTKRKSSFSSGGPPKRPKGKKTSIGKKRSSTEPEDDGF